MNRRRFSVCIPSVCSTPCHALLQTFEMSLKNSFATGHKLWRSYVVL
jgi:hypothetical protein